MRRKCTLVIQFDDVHRQTRFPNSVANALPVRVADLAPLADDHVDDAVDEALAAIASYVELPGQRYTQVVLSCIATNRCVRVERDVQNIPGVAPDP